MDQSNSDKAISDDKPPVLGSWNKIYLVVLLNLFNLIILFYVFSEALK